MIQTKYKSQRGSSFHHISLGRVAGSKHAQRSGDGQGREDCSSALIAVFSNFTFVKKKARNYKRWRKALGKDYFAFLATAFFNSCSLGETKPEIASWQICCN